MQPRNVFGVALRVRGVWFDYDDCYGTGTKT